MVHIMEASPYNLQLLSTYLHRTKYLQPNKLKYTLKQTMYSELCTKTHKGRQTLNFLVTSHRN